MLKHLTLIAGALLILGMLWVLPGDLGAESAVNPTWSSSDLSPLPTPAPRSKRLYLPLVRRRSAETAGGVMHHRSEHELDR